MYGPPPRRDPARAAAAPPPAPAPASVQRDPASWPPAVALAKVGQIVSLCSCPQDGSRRFLDVFFRAWVPKNTIKPMVFHVFSERAKTPPRRSEDRPIRPKTAPSRPKTPQDAPKTPPRSPKAFPSRSMTPPGLPQDASETAASPPRRPYTPRINIGPF